MMKVIRFGSPHGQAVFRAFPYRLRDQSQAPIQTALIPICIE